MELLPKLDHLQLSSCFKLMYWFNKISMLFISKTSHYQQNRIGVYSSKTVTVKSAIFYKHSLDIWKSKFTIYNDNTVTLRRGP